MRPDGRKYDELRPVKLTLSRMKFAEGSCLIEVGETRVLCTASVEEKVPAFLRGQRSGWVTAEYGMLPRSGYERQLRDHVRGQPRGRTYEIQRLVGRSLRTVCDLGALGERTLWMDCDVLQADGGTRTASIVGAFLALAEALSGLRQAGVIKKWPIRDHVAAVSVGVVGGKELLDLCYEEDSQAEVDMNVVMTGSGGFVEVQGTGEKETFSRSEMDQLLRLARRGIKELIEEEVKALKGIPEMQSLCPDEGKPKP